MAGDESKMYIVDTKSSGSSGDKSFVTLELSASRDAANRVASIRPVFVLSGALEPGWIVLDASRSYFNFARKSDQLMLRMQVDLNKSDYT